MVLFQPEGEDDLKKMQLMELAILNGTYRDQAKAMIPTLTRKCPSIILLDSIIWFIIHNCCCLFSA